MIDYLLENGLKALAFWIIGIAALICTAWMTGFLPGQQFPRISGERWQAVFLENNQVYFGKLTDDGRTYVTLTDVYYLRTAGDLSGESGKINLIKLGGELHGPEDTLHIPKDKILYWEDLQSSSQVVQTISARH